MPITARARNLAQTRKGLPLPTLSALLIRALALNTLVSMSDDTQRAASGGLMQGKRGLVMGVANERSIAWGIAQALHAQGAELAFTYQGDTFRKRVVPLAEPLQPA